MVGGITTPGGDFAMVRALSLVFVFSGTAWVGAADPLVWKADYQAARKESEAKKLPMLVVVGTDACYYCKKMEVTTFADESLVQAVAGKFVTLKIDANLNPDLTNALKVSQYPTCVLAGPDGKIHGFLQGYTNADDLKSHLIKTLEATVPNEVRAKLDQKNALLGKARADISQKKYADFLQGVNALQREGFEAEVKQLHAEFKLDAAKLVAEADKERDRTVTLYFAAAETFAKQGKLTEAVPYWETVVRIHPLSAEAQQSMKQLAKVRR